MPFDMHNTCGTGRRLVVSSTTLGPYSNNLAAKVGLENCLDSLEVPTIDMGSAGKREFGFNWADDVDDKLGLDRGIVQAKTTGQGSTSDTPPLSGENSLTEATVEGKLGGPAGIVAQNGAKQATSDASDPWWDNCSPTTPASGDLPDHDNSSSPTSPSNEDSLEWRPSRVNFQPAEPPQLPQAKQRNRRRFKQHTKQTAAVRPAHEWYESQAAIDPFSASIPKARAIIESNEPEEVVEDLWADYKKNKPLNFYQG